MIPNHAKCLICQIQRSKLRYVFKITAVTGEKLFYIAYANLEI